jgi:hypothetical protein
MKPFNEVLNSICSTLECEYREVLGDYMGITESPDGVDEDMRVHVTHNCQIWKNSRLIADGFASPTTQEGITETTKETAREWLLLSLITKAINQ